VNHNQGPIQKLTIPGDRNKLYLTVINKNWHEIINYETGLTKYDNESKEMVKVSNSNRNEELITKSPI